MRCFFHQGARRWRGRAAHRRDCSGARIGRSVPVPGGQLQVATALEMTGALEARLEVVRHELLDAARHLTGAKVLAARLYGVGPVTALAMNLLAGRGGPVLLLRKAVRFPGWTSRLLL